MTTEQEKAKKHLESWLEVLWNMDNSRITYNVLDIIANKHNDITKTTREDFHGYEWFDGLELDSEDLDYTVFSILREISELSTTPEGKEEAEAIIDKALGYIEDEYSTEHAESRFNKEIEELRELMKAITEKEKKQNEKGFMLASDAEEVAEMTQEILHRAFVLFYNFASIEITGVMLEKLQEEGRTAESDRAYINNYLFCDGYYRKEGEIYKLLAFASRRCGIDTFKRYVKKYTAARQ